MYNNLKGELKRKGLGNSIMAKSIGMPISTYVNKLNKGEFTISEAMAIRENHFPSEEYKYLFKKEKKQWITKQQLRV